MKALYRLGFASTAILGGLWLATPASAQATRTWISGVGDDANPCSRTAPCKTFAGAISKTAAGGEIDCLDPGGFGTVTIVKAITLNCLGPSNGGILSSSTNGIVVNAGADDDIYLIGIDIHGGSTGLNGIRFLAGGSLTLKHVAIKGTRYNGIEFAPTGTSTLIVEDTLIANTGQDGATYAGIQLRPTGAGVAKLLVERSQILTGRYGIIADGTGTTGKINGVVNDSSISGNVQNGITTSIGTASNATLTVNNAIIAGNGNNGLAASGINAGLLVGNTSVYGNGGGIFATAGSAIVSYGTNRVNGNNGNDGAFTTTIPQK
ncbi:hypothetical protein LWE61_17740 [Sphingobium sufflavum]|uniref:hypothetical protein n=1 Tax=Sphingobium sufflavum TaxID=1129547 RepID=UPI001F384FA1|nr:hypothetical protein [Sphingobium sufflavum]MCE7798383.1 hypothetical protein [Sphingobium sufflavum]